LDYSHFTSVTHTPGIAAKALAFQRGTCCDHQRNLNLQKMCFRMMTTIPCVAR
jgi:hypothetical protein